MKFAHGAPIRRLVRLLAIRSLLAGLDGEPETAALLISGMFELADSLSAEPLMFSQLLRLILNRTALQSLEQSLNRFNFSLETLGLLQDRLVEADSNRAFVQGLIGTRCMWDSVESIGWFGDPHDIYEHDSGIVWLTLIGPAAFERRALA